MPKVSVVTGYYNRGPFLERTIDSILSQTYADIELIVFDDKSTDGTGEKLLKLQDRYRDPRLKPIIHEHNTGFVRGMINAISQSSGEYIAVQGSADVSRPTRIEKQVAVLDADPGTVLVGCYFTNVIEENGIRRPRRPDAREMTFEKLVAGGNVFSHGEVMYRRSAYDRAGGYRPAFKASQDADLWLRMIKLGSFDTVRENLYDRYVQFDGVSYDPKKVVGQMRYSLLARRIATMDAAKQQEILAQLEKNGPMALIPNSDPDVQKKLMKTALRALMWGSTSSAREVAKHIERPEYITGYKLADLALTGPAKNIITPLISRLLGISRAQ